MTFAAVQKAQKRGQIAFETVRPGKVTIAGKDYVAAVEIMAAQPEQRSDGEGTVIAQRATACVRKTLLRVAPSRETMVITGGLNFTIASIGGQNVFDNAWVLHLVRLP